MSLSPLLSSFSLSSAVEGCSMCQRVADMPPNEQSLFFAILAGVFLGMAMGYAYFTCRAPLLPGLPYSRLQQPFLGLAPSVFKHYWELNPWKARWMTEVVDREIAKRRQKVVAVGDDSPKGKEGEDSSSSSSPPPPQSPVSPPDLLQWSIPFSPPFVELLTPRVLKFVLSDSFSSFEKGAAIREVFEELLGDGIFNRDGEGWRHQRKVASHLFSFHKLNEYMFTVFMEESEKLVAILSKAASSGEEVDLQRLFFDFTFDSICRIVFGVEMNQLGSDTPHPLCVAFDEVQSMIVQRKLSPPPLWKSKRFFNIGSERKFRKNIQVIDDFMYTFMRQRREQEEEFAESGDLLSLFLADANKRGETLSDRTMRNLCMNFLLAGRDTTAAALTWLFWNLSQHPAIEADVVAELREKLHPGVQPTPEAIKSLTRLEATFMETTRMQPPVPVDFKEAVMDTVFPGGEKVPKGTIVVYSPYVLFRLPSFYSSSPGLSSWAKDYDQFRPDRWLVDEDSNQQKKNKVLSPSAYEFPTFNAGLRLCLGRSMAILEGKVVASSILQQFTFRPRAGFQPKEKVTVVYAMLNGLPGTVHRRNN